MQRRPKKVSIEYVHIYPGGNEQKEIDAANEWAPRLLSMFEGDRVQACMVIDDIHSKEEITEEYIRKIVGKLVVKPHCVYKQSEYIREAAKLIESIDKKERDFIESREQTWLRESAEKYRSSTEFLLKWKNKKGDTEFSLPSLAATSYLTRLGLIEADGVYTVYGADIMMADQIVNLLPARFLQIESKAQSLIEASKPEGLSKISWFFY